MEEDGEEWVCPKCKKAERAMRGLGSMGKVTPISKTGREQPVTNKPVNKAIKVMADSGGTPVTVQSVKKVNQAGFKVIIHPEGSVATRKLLESQAVSKKQTEDPVVSKKLTEAQTISKKLAEAKVIAKKIGESQISSKKVTPSQTLHRKMIEIKVVSKRVADDDKRVDLSQTKQAISKKGSVPQETSSASKKTDEEEKNVVRLSPKKTVTGGEEVRQTVGLI